MSHTSYDTQKTIMQKENVIDQLNSPDAKKEVFYLMHVTLPEKALKILLKEEGIRLKELEPVNMGDLHGRMYRVVQSLKKSK